MYRPHDPKRRCFDFLATTTTEQKFAVWTSFHVKGDLFRTDLDFSLLPASLHQGLEKLIAIGRRDMSEEVRDSAF